MLELTRREDGFALPIAISILVIAGLLVLSTITLATHSTDRANRDRDAVRAGQAADAGVDAGLYRLNKALTASQAPGVLGMPVSAVAETACIQVSAGSLITVSATGGWCNAAGANEQIDGGIPGGPGFSPAGYSYRVSTGTNIGADPADATAHLVERRILSTGVVDGVSRRVLATVRARIGNGGNLLSVFEQVGYRTCTAQPTNPSDPASGC